MTTSTDGLWDIALTEIEREVSKAAFSTWFKDIFIVTSSDGAVSLSVPNQFVRDWIQKKYHTLILKTLRGVSDDIRSVEYIISKQQPPTQKFLQKQPQDNMVIADSLPLQDLYVNKTSNLNPRYTFDGFVVGSFNELAFAASQQILKSLGSSYNPYFVYGRTGYGKTHLIQAIGNAVLQKTPTAKVYYVTSEKFAQDLVNSLRSNKINAFKDKYRQYDLFIMDDIQFLSGKEKTQEELFHLFNVLYDSNKQIVFSSDQHPNYIPNLEERLKSRFKAGMIVDIAAPDRESRIAILESKAQAQDFVFADDVVDYVSSVVDGNVRDLEGALNSIVCQSQLKNKSLSLREVKDLLKNNIRPKHIVPVEDVVRLVSGFYNVDEESIYKKTRKKEVVKPRQLIMYILREDFGIAYPTIGQKIGGRDHTTVIHSYEKIKRELKTDDVLSREIDQLRGLL